MQRMIDTILELKGFNKTKIEEVISANEVSDFIQPAQVDDSFLKYAIKSASIRDTYFITVFPDENKIYCNCPHANNVPGFVCKHVYAWAKIIYSQNGRMESEKAPVKITRTPGQVIIYDFKYFADKKEYLDHHVSYREAQKTAKFVETGAIVLLENGVELTSTINRKQAIVKVTIENIKDLYITSEQIKSAEELLLIASFIIRINKNHFLNLFDFTEEKEKLLIKAGIDPNHPGAKLVQFEINDWSIRIHHVPSNYIFSTKNGFLEKIQSSLNIPREYENMNTLVDKKTDISLNYGFCMILHKNELEFKALKINTNKSNKLVYKEFTLLVDNPVRDLAFIPKHLFPLFLEFSFQQFNHYLEDKRMGKLHYVSEMNYGYARQNFRLIYNNYCFEVLYAHYNQIEEHHLLHLVLEHDRISSDRVQKVSLVKVKEQLELIALPETNAYKWYLAGMDAGSGEPIKDLEFYGHRVGYKDKILYLFENRVLAHDFLKAFPEGHIIISAKDMETFAEAVIRPFHRKHKLPMPELLRMGAVNIEPKTELHLSEFESKYLMLKPMFRYNEHLVDIDDDRELVANVNNKKVECVRDKDVEYAFREKIRALHPLFKTQRQAFFYLNFDEVLKKSWFLHTVQHLNEEGVPLIGINTLNKFKVNTSKPKIDFTTNISSGIDWFDVTVDISFGDMQVAFKDLRNAIINKQNFVSLGDGSIGMLPDEWLIRYTSMMRWAKPDSGKIIRYSKKHLFVLDDVLSELKAPELEEEYEAKKAKLLSYTGTDYLPVPSEITATLRDYQVAGYKWMQALDTIGWGGCLADDMGLGKTLQTITFLQYLANHYPNEKHIVVAPTSLVYNWQNEFKKFAPKLKFEIYHGSLRNYSQLNFDNFDILITSYGVARTDIELLCKTSWHYVILDESQAIKNPEAVTTKALQLLPAKNKIILSGTPVQNNTFDMYAQFNFLNPGLLGSKEFFKSQFANDIDRNGDKEKAAALRKLIHPFILRRTKEQVAKDLPDKIETILWCEMSPAQVDIYNEYKNFYRNSLLERIENEGMGKAGIYVLEGLLRLRQIANDPRLVGSEEDNKVVGVKTLELTREITENAGEHKMLVFSQFTEMLSLVKLELDKEKISYCYIDGSVTAEKRQKEVERFQNDSDVHVFLISLKAGGVGLTLTAADYVYIIDPWWNPAAEQQAIDRTHRIGQKKTVFSYKMICKDTVEEKILQLQEKKRSLSKDLVSDDQAIFKSLTKEDISFIFE